MYEDGHIHSVQVNEANENESHCFVRCKAIPSMPAANKKQCPDYNVWVMLSKMTGCVNSAECTCTAGEGEGCNHVSGLLYAIADITDKKRDGKLAPTSVKCKWSNPRKRKLTPRKSQDVIFEKVVHARDSSMVKRNILAPVYNVKVPFNVENFKEKLLGMNSNAGWLKNFKIKSERQLIPKLHNINYCIHDNVDISSDKYSSTFNDYLANLTITEIECVQIECLTRNQSDSDLWTEARVERLTASNFGRVCKLKSCTNPESVLKDILNYRTFESRHTRYGCNHENVARLQYTKRMRKSHPGLSVKNSGLLVTPEHPHLGASPDGFVNFTHCKDHNGLLEIKCPSSIGWRMRTPEECALDSKSFCTMQDDKVSLKRNHNYYYQVQGQLGISGRNWCDFVVWTCAGMSVERIFADHEFFKNIIVKTLNEFYIKVFIPELFTRRVERGIRLFK